MATPLTDSINALTTYANEVTGASDTTLSDAVHTLASGYGGGGTRTTIVPEQTITGTSQWTLIPNSGTLIEGEYYAVTVNGEEKISTGTVYDGIVYISFINWDWDNGGYAFGSDVGGNGVYFRTNESESYTIKVDRLTISNEATLITKSITANGTYSASDDSADGYSSVTVNVPSNGASSWTKVAETSYQVSTTSTSAATVDTWATGHSEIWTSDKIVYVRVRDTAGKRNGYFYGSDQFYMNYYPITSGSTSSNYSIRYIWRYTADESINTSNFTATTGYGVYTDTIYNDGSIRVRSRYSSSQSLTINGTYKVEVYLLDPPTGAPIFE